jgi:hypothetical protein
VTWVAVTDDPTPADVVAVHELIEGLRMARADRASSVLSHLGLDHRVRFVAGSFFETIPTSADAYVLKAILHDWDDDRAEMILSACHRSMSADATLIVAGMIIPEAGLPSPAKEFDLQMLAMQTGRERTATELGHLLSAAGLELQAVYPTSTPLSVSVARPV